MKILSPEIDLLIQSVRNVREAGSTAPDLFESVRESRALLEKIKPVIDGRDSIWSLWIRTERGQLHDFGDYDEYRDAGDVESREDFESLWRMEYPDEVQWRRLRAVHYDNRLFFYLDRTLDFNVDLASGMFYQLDPAQDDARRLVIWLLQAMRDEVHKFLLDPVAYNRDVERNLPLCKRFGRVRRRDLWSASSEVIRLDDEIGAEGLGRFRRLILDLDENATIDRMTLSAFLSYCRICYEANDYEQLESSMTPREMYRAMADNRDEGLLDLPSDDPSAFTRWYRERQGGGHPFEICRGGNRTHISLYVLEHGDGWQLRLAGFSTARAVETARMAIALSEHGVAFMLEFPEEMLRMLSGEDFLGIVPEDIPVGYNHGDFPKEDHIHSYLHLYVIEDTCESLPGSITWYPLDELVPSGDPGGPG